jgi:predicted DNA-binding transcriptional regulator AlpA
MTAHAFIRLPDVRKATGLGRSTIYRLISEGQFPKPIKLAARSVAWCSAEIAAWMSTRMALRGA